MSKKSIAVLFGGGSAQHDTSKESAAAIISLMSDEKYLTVPIYVTREGSWMLYDGPLLNFKTVPFEKFSSKAVISPDKEHRGLLRIVNDKVKNIPLDVVFPVIDGVQGLFELAGIPYVGCGVLSSELCSSRVHIRQIVKDVGLAQADYFEFDNDDLDDMSQVTKKVRYKLGYPVIVRPDGDRVENKKELEEAIERSAQSGGKVVVEKEVSGRKINCLVIGDDVNTEGAIIDTEGELSEDTTQFVLGKAAEIFKAACCYGLVQISFILQEDNNLLFNEIKTIPDYVAVEEYSVYQNDVLIDKLIDMALRRCAR